MRTTVVIAILFAACSRERPVPTGGAQQVPAREFEPPVATNAESPIAYPPTLYEQGIEGTVLLRLFINETGNIVPDSTRIAEGSGYPQLDSAALAGVPALRFAPARQGGRPIATPFLQPVHFRLPEGGAERGG